MVRYFKLILGNPFHIFIHAFVFGFYLALFHRLIGFRRYTRIMNGEELPEGGLTEKGIQNLPKVKIE